MDSTPVKVRRDPCDFVCGRRPTKSVDWKETENQWREPSATRDIVPKDRLASYRPRAVFREGRTQSLGKTLRLMTSTTVVIRATMRKAVSSPVWRAMKPIAAGPARIPA